MHSIGRHKASSITIENGCVIKKIRSNKYPDFDLFENELKWLTEMSDFDRVPNVIDSDPVNKTIVMEYVGEPISNENIPADWSGQADYILANLTKYNCSHNDIKPTEILVKRNKIYLIDFGWATTTGSEIPKHFPKRLGSKFRQGIHNFDDRYSLYKSIRFILRKK